jgi:hypothetical protein
VGAEPDEIAEFYLDHPSAIIAGGTMSLVSIALFLFFLAIVHRALADADGPRAWLPGAALAGGIALAAAGLVAEGVNTAGALRAEGDGAISGQAAQLYYDVSQMMGFPVAGVGFAVLAASVALVALRTGRVIPRWLALLSFPVALVSLIPPVAGVAIGLLPVWAILLALLLDAPSGQSRGSSRRADGAPASPSPAPAGRRD